MSCPIRKRQAIAMAESVNKPSNPQLYNQNELSLKQLMESRMQQDQYFMSAFAGTNGHPAPSPPLFTTSIKHTESISKGQVSNTHQTYPLSN